MDITLISQPRLKHDEANVICHLFEVGLEKLHIRKPTHSALEISRLLDSIPDQFLSHIVMHRIPQLVNDYGLAGYHHADGEDMKDCRGTSSRSIHSLKDLSAVDGKFDYFFYGPVYKSISKKGYKPKVPLSMVKEVLDLISPIKNRPKVYAIGGIRRKKIMQLMETGFDGFALLGSIWSRSDPVDAFSKFKHHCEESEHAFV